MTVSDSTQRFTDRVAAYVAARPGYPDAVAKLLAHEFRLAPGARVADLGCGTGLSCVPFLRAGFAVIGVEPNDAMRAACENFLAAHGSFRAVAGTAEATTLEEASVDLVIAAQAAHWFDTAAARIEARRILRGPARAALIWNDRKGSGSPLAEGYERLLLEFGDDYAQVRHRAGHVQNAVTSFFGNGTYRAATFENPSRLDFPTLLARVGSASYMPRPDAPNYAPMVERLRALFDASQRDGRVAMDHTTRVFFGEVPA